jgi:hypothetical protein
MLLSPKHIIGADDHRVDHILSGGAMNFRKITLMVCCSALFPVLTSSDEGCLQASKTQEASRHEYFGQKPPGATPEVFASGIVSSRFVDGPPVFTSGLTEAYWSRGEKKGWGQIMGSRMSGGRWLPARPVAFSRTEFKDSKPALSTDGCLLVFASDRAIDGLKPENPSFLNIWTARRDRSGDWLEPIPATAVNSPWDEDFPVLSPGGALYFSSNRPGYAHFYSIFSSRPAGDAFGPPAPASFPFETQYGEAVQCFGPEGRFVVFASMKPGGAGSSDLYVSFRGPDGAWEDAVNLGPEVNTTGTEMYATLSPDFKYLFFTSDRSGNQDVYWVDARIIDVRRKTR